MNKTGLTILLIGPPGSGKTSLENNLAQKFQPVKSFGVRRQAFKEMYLNTPLGEYIFFHTNGGQKKLLVTMAI